MRQLAWLSATPKPKNPQAPITDARSRSRRLEDEGADLPLPPCPYPQLIEFLMEIGPVMAGAMGAVPVGWRDISAWAECTGIRLSPWAARAVRRLSIEWLSASQAGEAEDCPPPWVESPAVREAQTTASLDDKLRAAMMMMTNKGARP